MAQIPPILDEYIDDVIKSSGDYVATKNKTQGIKLRELVKKLRDYFEQEIPKRTSDLINDSDFVVQDFLKELPEEGNSKRPFIIRPLVNFDPDQVFGTNGQPVHMMLIATEEVNGKIVPVQMKVTDGVTPFKDLKNLIAEIDLSGKVDKIGSISYTDPGAGAEWKPYIGEGDKGSYQLGTISNSNGLNATNTIVVADDMTFGSDFGMPQGNGIYFKSSEAGGNTVYKKLAYSEELSSKVSKTGDAMTGILKIDRGKIGTTPTSGLELSNVTGVAGDGAQYSPALTLLGQRAVASGVRGTMLYIKTTAAGARVNFDQIIDNITRPLLSFLNGSLNVAGQSPNTGGNFNLATLTDYRDWLLPDKSGTIALLDDIPAPVDISGKEDISNKATTLANPNNVTYPTTQAVSNELANKATLDDAGKVPVSQLPDAILGALQFQSQWNASTNTPAIPTASAQNKGHFYITQTAGVYNSVNYNVGDWILSNGTGWEKISNSDAVTSVFGRIGSVVAVAGDYTSDQILNQSSISGNYITDALEQLNNAKADDVSVVHKTGDEYINGNKTFETIQVEAVKITNTIFQPGDGDSDDIYEQKLQRKNGTIALTSDIPSPGDISSKEDKSNKATNLTSPDDVKYPTTQAVSSALAAKADDANVVHKTGDETITGVKTFTKPVKLTQETRTFDTRRTAGTLFPDQGTILTYPKNMQYGYEAIGSNVITGAIMLKVPLYDRMFSIDLLVEHWSATGSDYSFIKMKLDGYNWGANGSWALGNVIIIDGYGHLLTDFKDKNVTFGTIAENSGKAFTPIIKIGEVTDTYSNVELNIIVERITINNDNYNNAADDYLSTRMYTSADLPTITTGLSRTVQIANWLNLPAAVTIATTSDLASKADLTGENTFTGDNNTFPSITTNMLNVLDDIYGNYIESQNLSVSGGNVDIAGANVLNFSRPIKKVNFDTNGFHYDIDGKNDYTILVTGTAINGTMTLPDARNVKGRIFVFKAIESASAQVDVYSGGTIDMESTVRIVPTSAGLGEKKCMTLQAASDGSNEYYVIGQF